MGSTLSFLLLLLFAFCSLIGTNMTENLRQRKRNEVSSNDDRPISIDPNDKTRVKSSSISTIGLIFVATGLIVLCLFIQFALPHEDHLTKQFVKRKKMFFSQVSSHFSVILRLYQQWTVDLCSSTIFFRIAKRFLLAKVPNRSKNSTVKRRFRSERNRTSFL